LNCKLHQSVLPNLPIKRVLKGRFLLAQGLPDGSFGLRQEWRTQKQETETTSSIQNHNEHCALEERRTNRLTIPWF
jgi:hypothetical protein